MDGSSFFMPLRPVDPEVTASARYSARSEVSSLTDRPAPHMWRALFHHACDASPDIDWHGAGFAECALEDVDRVTSRLNDIANSTNRAFGAHLAEASADDRARLMAEGINHFGEPGDAYRIFFP
jgi:hypothetical protein